LLLLSLCSNGLRHEVLLLVYEFVLHLLVRRSSRSIRAGCLIRGSLAEAS
jgi:hypothetical protein